jgi:hypothetical protein
MGREAATLLGTHSPSDLPIPSVPDESADLYYSK